MILERYTFAPEGEQGETKEDDAEAKDVAFCLAEIVMYDDLWISNDMKVS